MDIGIVSKRYAKALYEYAAGAKQEQKVYAEMLTLADSYAKVSTLRQALANPVLTKDEKADLLCKAAGGNVSEEYRRFVALVLDEKREYFMQFIAYSYISLYRKRNHINIGTLITASPAAPDNLERLKAMVGKATQGTVEFINTVDPSIVGGFILEINSNRLDASVESQINKVRRQFAEKNSRIL